MPSFTDPARARRLPGAFLAGLALLLALAGPPGLGQGEGEAKEEIKLPPDFSALLDRSTRVGDLWVLEGNVEFRTGDGTIHADRVEYDETKETILATGDVVLSFPGATLTGSRMVYRLNEERGELDNVVGYLELDGAIFRASRAERIGDKRIRVHDAVFTTCTQPTPYWSFRIKRGTFDIGEYAYMRGVGFKVSKAPIFYTPYLVWPIKRDRASGLLFPDISNSDTLGTAFSLPLYWAFSDHADVTFFFDGYTKVGFGIGSELRWLPSSRGRAEAEAYWIDDLVREKQRYRYAWKHRQTLPGDIKLQADVEVISDFDYVTDYETDLNRSSSPQTVSRITFKRDWSWYTATLNTRLQEQYFTSGTTTTSFLSSKGINGILPEFEIRGRSRRLGKTPFYLSFTASAARFTRRIQEAPEGSFGVQDESLLETSADYSWSRYDLFPRINMPLVKQTWADLTFNVGWRGTYYSHRPDPDDFEQVVDESVKRSFLTAGFVFQGPRVQRIFETPGWSFSPKLKHVIEPFVEYSYQPESSVKSSEIIRVDEVDTIPGERSDLRYGLRQRFYVLRPADSGRVSSLLSAEETSFEAIEKEEERLQREEENLSPEEELAAQVEVSPQLNPMEIGSLEIFQNYSFVREGLSRKYALLTDAEGEVIFDDLTGRPETIELASRRYSPVTMRARLNPSSEHTVDMSYVFDLANDKLTETRLSSTMRLTEGSYFQGSWFRREPEDPGSSDPTSFLRAKWGGSSPNRRLTFEVDMDYDIEDGELDHQRYTVRYSSQCCTVRLGYDRRDFVDNSRQEVFLKIDLTGIGELLEFRESLSR